MRLEYEFFTTQPLPTLFGGQQGVASLLQGVHPALWLGHELLLNILQGLLHNHQLLLQRLLHIIVSCSCRGFIRKVLIVT